MNNMNESEEKEFRRLEKDRHTAMGILADIFDCGRYDVECILSIEQNHPGSITEAIGYASDVDGDLDFGAVVEGAKTTSIEDIDDLFTEMCDQLNFSQEEAESFIQSIWDMQIDDNYSAWGGIADYGDYCGDYEDANREFQDNFADFVYGSMDVWTFLSKCRCILKDAMSSEDE